MTDALNFDSFKINKDENDSDMLSIMNKGSDLLYCKTRCDFRFNYGGYDAELNISINPPNNNILKLKPSDNSDYNIVYNKVEYNLKHILITKTYHLMNNSENFETSNIDNDCSLLCGNNFIEVFLCHESKNAEEDNKLRRKKLVISLIVGKKIEDNENNFNGKNLNNFFETLWEGLNAESSKFYFNINDLFKNSKTKSNWGNSFWHYENGKFIYDIKDNNDPNIEEVDDVIVMSDICYHNNAQIVEILVDKESAYDNINPNREERPISFNVEGSKNTDQKNIETKYDLVDCQEYSGLDDHLKDNDKLIVNEQDKKEKEIKDDGYAVYLIKILNEYKVYIIAWLLIIIQIILFYYLLKYIYNKWNPNE